MFKLLPGKYGHSRNYLNTHHLMISFPQKLFSLPSSGAARNPIDYGFWLRPFCGHSSQAWTLVSPSPGPTLSPSGAANNLYYTTLPQLPILTLEPERESFIFHLCFIGSCVDIDQCAIRNVDGLRVWTQFWQIHWNLLPSSVTLLVKDALGNIS